MKILFIPTSYPDEQNTTRNVFIYEQAVGLFRLGHDIRILHPQKQPSKNLFRKMDYNVKIHNEGYAIRYSCPVKTFMADRFVLFNKRLFVNTVYRLYGAAVADGWKPDVIYAHFSCWAGVAAVNLGKTHEIPVVVIEHFGGFLKKSPAPKLIEGLSYSVKNANAVICVSNNLRDKVWELTKTTKNISVIPNMVNPCFCYSVHEVKDKFVFATICNLNKGKRVKELVYAFCLAFDEKEKIELLIGGDGPEKNKIAKLIKQNHREHQVFLLGRLDRAGTLELYKKANSFVLASAFETFGIVWREAMATGLPVITTNHGGWSKIEWSDDFGIMIPVDDERALVKALKDMKENFMHYDGREISACCCRNHSESVVVKQIEDALKRCCYA